MSTELRKWARPWRINEVMYEARKRKLWTLQKCADEVGLSVKHYTRIENGERTTCLATYKRIADVLGVPLSEVLGEVFIDDL